MHQPRPKINRTQSNRQHIVAAGALVCAAQAYPLRQPPKLEPQRELLPTSTIFLANECRFLREPRMPCTSTAVGTFMPLVALVNRTRFPCTSSNACKHAHNRLDDNGRQGKVSNTVSTVNVLASEPSTQNHLNSCIAFPSLSFKVLKLIISGLTALLQAVPRTVASKHASSNANTDPCWLSSPKGRQVPGPTQSSVAAVMRAQYAAQTVHWAARVLLQRPSR